MTESQSNLAWWETCSNAEFIKQFLLHPIIVLRQIEVAADIASAPIESDQETYPTLLPKDAKALTKKKRK